MIRFGILGLLVLAAVGCGDKSTPPMTTDQLPKEQIATESQPAAGSNTFQRPEGNPNAPYKPRR